MNIQWLIVSALIIIAILSFFIEVPTKNMDIVKTIITAFIAYLTGYATAKWGGKDEKNTNSNDTTNM